MRTWEDEGVTVVKKTESEGKFADGKPGIDGGCVEFKVVVKYPGRERKHHTGVVGRCPEEGPSRAGDIKTQVFLKDPVRGQ